MPWLRSGDNAATYPLLLALGFCTDADDRTLNEVGGWLWRCAMQSAGHLTDGQIDAGTAQLMGGARTRELISAATEAGLIARVAGAVPPRWQIIDDPEFIHIRSKESVEWDRQRDRDRKNPDLTSAVRFRDGDACRYCGVAVNHRARTGARAGTYDHLDPGRPATLDTYVVMCRGCNSRRQDGERLELLAPPARPFYHPATVEWLHEHGHQVPDGYRSEPARAAEGLTPGGHRRDTARPAPARDTAPGRDQDPAADGATRSPQPPATPDPWAAIDPDAPPAWIRQDPPADRGGSPDGTGRAGTGQDGSGRAGPGRGGAGAAKRRRGRRGRRSGGGGR